MSEATNWLSITDMLTRGVSALERIADALEAANANDPLTAISKAMEAKDSDNPPIPEWMLR